MSKRRRGIYYNGERISVGVAKAQMAAEGWDTPVMNMVVEFAEKWQDGEVSENRKAQDKEVNMAANEKTDGAVQSKRTGGWYVPKGQGKGRGKKDQSVDTKDSQFDRNIAAITEIGKLPLMIRGMLDTVKRQSSTSDLRDGLAKVGVDHKGMTKMEMLAVLGKAINTPVSEQTPEFQRKFKKFMESGNSVAADSKSSVFVRPSGTGFATSGPSTSVPERYINKTVRAEIGGLFPRLKEPDYTNESQAVAKIVKNGIAANPDWTKHVDKYAMIVRQLSNHLATIESIPRGYTTGNRKKLFSRAASIIVSLIAGQTLPSHLKTADYIKTSSATDAPEARAIQRIVKLAISRYNNGPPEDDEKFTAKHDAKLDDLIKKHLGAKPFPQELETLIKNAGVKGVTPHGYDNTNSIGSNVRNLIIDRIRKIHGPYDWEK